MSTYHKLTKLSKSNLLYIVHEKAQEAAQKTYHIKIPKRLKNAVAKLNQDMVGCKE